MNYSNLEPLFQNDTEGSCAEVIITNEGKIIRTGTSVGIEPDEDTRTRKSFTREGKSSGKILPQMCTGLAFM
jgi:hypothetical protein